MYMCPTMPSSEERLVHNGCSISITLNGHSGHGHRKFRLLTLWLDDSTLEPELLSCPFLVRHMAQ